MFHRIDENNLVTIIVYMLNILAIDAAWTLPEPENVTHLSQL